MELYATQNTSSMVQIHQGLLQCYDLIMCFCPCFYDELNRHTSTSNNELELPPKCDSSTPIILH